MVRTFVLYFIATVVGSNLVRCFHYKTYQDTYIGFVLAFFLILNHLNHKCTSRISTMFALFTYTVDWMLIKVMDPTSAQPEFSLFFSLHVIHSRGNTYSEKG